MCRSSSSKQIIYNNDFAIFLNGIVRFKNTVCLKPAPEGMPSDGCWVLLLTCSPCVKSSDWYSWYDTHESGHQDPPKKTLDKVYYGQATYIYTDTLWDRLRGSVSGFNSKPIANDAYAAEHRIRPLLAFAWTPPWIVHLCSTDVTTLNFDFYFSLIGNIPKQGVENSITVSLHRGTFW